MATEVERVCLELEVIDIEESLIVLEMQRRRRKKTLKMAVLPEQRPKKQLPEAMTF